MNIKGHIAKPALSIQLIGARRFYLGLLLSAGLWIVAYLLMLMGMTTVFYIMQDTPKAFQVNITDGQLFKARLSIALLSGLAAATLCSVVWFYRPSIRLKNRFVTFVRIQHMLWALPLMIIMVYLTVMLRSSLLLIVPGGWAIYFLHYFNPFSYSFFFYFLPVVFFYLYQWMLVQRLFSKTGFWKLTHFVLLLTISLCLSQFIQGDLSLAQRIFSNKYPYFSNSYQLPLTERDHKLKNLNIGSTLLLQQDTSGKWCVIVDFKQCYALDSNLPEKLFIIGDSVRLVNNLDGNWNNRHYYETWEILADSSTPMYQLSYLVQALKKRDLQGETRVLLRTKKLDNGHFYNWGYEWWFRNYTYLQPPEKYPATNYPPRGPIKPGGIEYHFVINNRQTIAYNGALVTTDYLRKQAIKNLVTNNGNWVVFFESDSTATYGNYIRFLEDYYAAVDYVNYSILIPAHQKPKLKTFVPMDFLLQEEVNKLWYWTDSLQKQ